MKPNLQESVINRSDINSIFSDAVYLRSKPTGLSRLFKGLRKEQIGVEDLQQAWSEAGHPNDTRDISRILLKFGFDENEIKKVFGQVFKTDNTEYDDEIDAPRSSEAVQKVANFAIKNGLQKNMIDFLEQEFGKELGLKEVTNEEVHQIFKAMMQEERTARARLIKEEDKNLLGRTRK